MQILRMKAERRVVIARQRRQDIDRFDLPRSQVRQNSRMYVGIRIVVSDPEWYGQRHDDESGPPCVCCGLHAGNERGDLRPVPGVVDPPIVFDRRMGESSLLEHPFDDSQAPRKSTGSLSYAGSTGPVAET